MKMVQEIRGDVVILRLSGQFMGGPDADAVREQILAAIDRGLRKFLVDLGEVSWVNSTGLGILITAHLAATNNGGAFRLMRVSRRIESIFATTRLDTIFRTYPDEEAALLAFAS